MTYPSSSRMLLRRLEGDLRSLVDSRQYAAARAVIDSMISALQRDPSSFDEVEDRLRILRARQLMLTVREERLTGGHELPQYLRAAASASTPSLCDNAPCASGDPELCTSRQSQLSERQARMCIEKLAYLTDALKLEAFLLARARDHTQGASKLRAAIILHRGVVGLDPRRQQNQHYLEYWCAIKEGYVALHSGDFAGAQAHYRTALDHAPLLNQRRCFPNYFRDIREVHAHQHYIDGIAAFRDGQFAAAGAEFDAWLQIHWDREGQADLRFDNLRVFSLVCTLLSRLKQNEAISKAEWRALDELLVNAYIAPSTWALHDSLGLLREFARRQNPPALRGQVEAELQRLSEEWRSLLFDETLLAGDATLEIEPDLGVPRFLEVFDLFDAHDAAWPDLLAQNSKMMILVLADYEYHRYRSPRGDADDFPKLAAPPVASEEKSRDSLERVVSVYLRRRSEQHARWFENARQHLDTCDAAINAREFRRAVAAQREFLATIRTWPHVIRVVAQEKSPAAYAAPDETPDFLAYQTIAERLWNRKNTELRLEGPDVLSVGRTYYLRPRWNLRAFSRYRIRHEEFLPSTVAASMDTLYRYLAGSGTVADKARFTRWIVQFKDTERLRACHLLDLLEFYSEQRIRDMWLRVFRTQLPPETKSKGVALIGLGHSAKSGPFTTQYHLRQALRQLGSGERSFEDKEAFREIGEYTAGLADCPRSVVFVDDFIGTGEQASRLINAYYVQHPWLRATNAYHCSLVGFRDGIDFIKRTTPVIGVVVGDEFGDDRRAFSPSNPAWTSPRERTDLEAWAAEIGRDLLIGRSGYDPDRHCLGWEGSQALVVFHYNVPNNTLPIFWGAGVRQGANWESLITRYD